MAETRAQTSRRGRIDVHAHYVPDGYRGAAVAAGHAQPDGMPGLPAWNPDLALQAMDAAHVDTALLSVSSPGVHFGDDQAARMLARQVNEEGAGLIAEHGRRFGLFASLPLPDVDGTLAEIAYAFDTLNADGVVMLTNSHGVYPADPRFDPVFAELDRRSAVVFLHPTSPCCTCCNPVGMSWPRPMMEFLFETTRAVADLVLEGALDRYRNLRLIIPHAGAALTVLADRLQAFSALAGAARGEAAIDVLQHLRRCYYDLAGFALPRQLPVLQTLTDPHHILYGSDWPFTPSAVVEQLAGGLTDFFGAGTDAEALIRRRNAEALFPRLAS